MTQKPDQEKSKAGTLFFMNRPAFDSGRKVTWSCFDPLLQSEWVKSCTF
jgi:hypothetical protein